VSTPSEPIPLALERSSPKFPRDLVERHFVMQKKRPAGIREVEIERLDPFLRGLLFTDGTVTRALGAQALAPVQVECLGQSWASMPDRIAGLLDAERGTEAVRRRVSIGVACGSGPVLWAESFMLPDRLPDGFLGQLDEAPDGIGQSIQHVSLESSRELLWFGLDAVPEWATAVRGAADGTLRRLYRIVSGGNPAILISEHFAVTGRDSGAHRLVGLDRPADDARQAGDIS
jgi:chorismate-pyruvate lyase